MIQTWFVAAGSGIATTATKTASPPIKGRIGIYLVLSLIETLVSFAQVPKVNPVPPASSTAEPASPLRSAKPLDARA